MCIISAPPLNPPTMPCPTPPPPLPTGFYMRTGLPEPKAFLNRCRAEQDTATKAAMVDGVSASIHPAPSAKR